MTPKTIIAAQQQSADGTMSSAPQPITLVNPGQIKQIHVVTSSSGAQGAGGPQKILISGGQPILQTTSVHSATTQPTFTILRAPSGASQPLIAAHVRTTVLCTDILTN